MHDFSFPLPTVRLMTDFEKVFDFHNLYKAHLAARRGKRHTREVIEFELALSENLVALSDELKSGRYKIQGYYSFSVHDPKFRIIHALHYRDRVMQHCLCDEVLQPLLDNKLIYDNAACRIGKGTHFAVRRVSEFLHKFYTRYGTDGYALKCDIRKFFGHIDHDVLKEKLSRVIKDAGVLALVYQIIDSFEIAENKGIPLGNQTSQWFAIYYLDGLDRLVKEKLGIKYYSRYMDDCVLIHQDREYLRDCCRRMRNFLEKELKLEFNEKTELFPLRNGINYLGWHFYLSDTGKIIRKVKQQTKHRYRKTLRGFQESYSTGEVDLNSINQSLSSYRAHLSHGHTYRLQQRMMREFALRPRLSEIGNITEDH